jgi:hypothetical protein
MKHSPDSPLSKPTLEALLRLKREESPDAAFWADFEVRMRQKQLAAIIEPKPWWLGVSLVLRRFSLPALVVTSGAAAAFAFVVMRNGAPVTAPGFAAAPASQIASTTVEAFGAEHAEAPPAVVGFGKHTREIIAGAEASEALLIVKEEAGFLDGALVSPSLSVAASIPASAGIAGREASSEDLAIRSVADSEMLVGLVENQSVVAGRADESSAEMIPDLVEPAVVAADFPVAETSFEFASLDYARISWTPERVILPGNEEFGAPALEATSATFAFGSDQSEKTVLPDAVVPAPGSRFERLLSAESPKVAGTSGALAQVRDRVLHHLGGDEELYASVSRLGVGGDRLSLRF